MVLSSRAYLGNHCDVSAAQSAGPLGHSLVPSFPCISYPSSSGFHRTTFWVPWTVKIATVLGLSYLIEKMPMRMTLSIYCTFTFCSNAWLLATHSPDHPKFYGYTPVTCSSKQVHMHTSSSWTHPHIHVSLVPTLPRRELSSRFPLPAFMWSMMGMSGWRSKWVKK